MMSGGYFIEGRFLLIKPTQKEAEIAPNWASEKNWIEGEEEFFMCFCVLNNIYADTSVNLSDHQPFFVIGPRR